MKIRGLSLGSVVWTIAFTAVCGCSVKVTEEDDPTPGGKETGTGGALPNSAVGGASASAAGGSGGGESSSARQKPTFGTAAGGMTGVGGAAAVPREDGALQDGSRDASRAIQEADIVQVSGKRLYAMSSVGGLSVIDISQRDQLSILGRYRVANAVPFEMLVRGSTVIGLFSGVSKYDSTGKWVGATSQVVALDVDNPSQIRSLGSFDLPGGISDSRAVGNILYAVSYENGSCYNCQATPATLVLSLDISDPTKIREIDRLPFPERLRNSDNWTQRSISVNDQRMYVGGLSDSGSDSKIQVVDISDPAGDMKLGETITVDGTISSRWQMDEYEGVLRVVSQPALDVSQPPVVQTFSVTKSFAALGKTSLTIPENEQLRSVRFDGTRAYAITAIKEDPLFTIDLSDPAAPKQVGELELPGWIYHMEPQGKFMLALGMDTDNEDSLHVSLINVEDLAKPTLIKRVNFGGSWAEVAEDQNRVHKLFNILSELGLILVPYSGEASGCGSYRSGIQIIQYTPTTLTLQGVAPAIGTARRAFIYDERLFSVSEERVQVFNVDDLEAPKETASKSLVQRVHRTVPVGNKVLRIRSDWWMKSGEADLSSIDAVESPMSETPLNLSAAVYGSITDNCSYYYDYNAFRQAPAFAFGSHVALAVSQPGLGTTTILVLDTSGNAPTVAAQLKLNTALRTTDLGPAAVQSGNYMVLLGAGKTQGDQQQNAVAVVDLSDPTHPKLVSTLDRAYAWGTTGFYPTATGVANGYYTTSDSDGSLQFFTDRVDLSATGVPSARDPLAVPGLLVAPNGERLLTVDFADVVSTDLDSTQCYYRNGTFDYETNQCVVSQRTLKVVGVSGSQATTLAENKLDDSLRIAAVYSGDQRLFLPSVRYVDGYNKETMVVLEITDTALNTTLVDLPARPFDSTPLGKSLYFLSDSKLKRLDTTNIQSPVVTDIASLYSDKPNDLALTADRAIVALDDFGVQSIPLK